MRLSNPRGSIDLSVSTSFASMSNSTEKDGLAGIRVLKASQRNYQVNKNKRRKKN